MSLDDALNKLGVEVRDACNLLSEKFLVFCSRADMHGEAVHSRVATALVDATEAVVLVSAHIL